MTFSPEELSAALGLALHWHVMAALAAGIALGILVGGLPGITTVTAMAIVLPVSFFLDPLLGIPFLVGLYKGGIYGGSIPAILIATPGTGASVATTYDGPALVRAGKGRKALDTALYASVVGDSVSDVWTLLLIVPISTVALLAGPPELAAILILSILITVFAVSKSWTNGAIMACLGVLLATIGRDPLEFTSRLTFGLDVLDNGVPLLPMLIGLFAVPEIARMAGSKARSPASPVPSVEPGPPLTLREFIAMKRTLVRSCGLGMLLGVIPGIGQPVAAHTSYALAKQASHTPERYGHGSLEGIAAAETANNAVNGPTLVPLLTLGIPGDKVTAVLLGAFVAQGLRPGPQLLENQGSIVLALLLAMLFSNLLVLGIAKVLIPFMARIVSVKQSVLAPVVLVLALTGAYLYRSDPGDLYFLAFFGAAGICARQADVELAPLILAFILCENLEYSVAQTVKLMSGNTAHFFVYEHPVSLLLTLTTVGAMTYMRVKKRSKR